jgi:flagellar assembly factor FliW
LNIQTKFHGNIDIQADQTWHFPKGIPGFEDENEFVLLPIEGNEAFQVLQSIKTSTTAFIVASPYTLIDDYSFDVDEPTVDLLNIKNEQDIFVLSVISIKEPFESSTINLQAPLIFQTTTRKARQMILNDNRFSLRHPISTSTAKKGDN